MHCPDCHSDVPENAVFCPRCGRHLVDEEVEPVSPAQIPAKSSVAPAAASRFQPSGGDTGPGGIQDDPETEVWSGTYSPKAMISTWMIAGLLTIVAMIVYPFLGEKPGWALPLFLGIMLLVWIGLALRLFLQRLNVHYRLTTQRFVHEEGILRRRTDRIEVIDIDDVSYDQGLIDRMVGVGTIRLTSSDRTHNELVLKGIENVHDIASQIDNARRRERVRRGLHIEAV